VTRRRDRAVQQRRPADRRPGLIPGRRFALVVAVTGGLLVHTGAAASADSSGPLVSATVHSANGTTAESVSVAQLQASSQCPVYGGPQTMDEMGHQGPVDVTLSQTNTWALSTILGCLQPNPVPLTSVQGVTVFTADGTPETDSGSEITPADLKPLGQTDFNNPNEGPAVTALGTANEYDRPWRGSSQGQPDYDYSDQVVTGSPGGQAAPVDIEVFEGPLLTVTANASETTVAVGATVTFSATVTPQSAGSLSYSWTFDGGAANSTAATPQVTFGTAGQYDVTVQVTDSQGGGGVASIPITVGSTPAPTTGSHPQSGAGTNHKSHTPTGPKKSKGTHAGARPGKSKSSASSSTGAGNSTSNKATTSSTTPTSTTSTQASTPSTHPATTATPHRAAARSATRRRLPAPRARPTSPPPVSGPLVKGQLISDVTPLAASPLVHTVPPPAATAPPARQAIRASLLPAVGAAFAVLLLFSLGAWRELRGRR
jgi:hypothetical protein